MHDFMPLRLVKLEEKKGNGEVGRYVQLLSEIQLMMSVLIYVCITCRS